MFVRRRIPWTWTLYFAWPSLLYFLLLAMAVYWWRRSVHQANLEIPFEPVTILATGWRSFSASRTTRLTVAGGRRGRFGGWQ